MDCCVCASFIRVLQACRPVLLGHQPKRGRVPARGAGGRPRGVRVAGLEQQLDRGALAADAGLLDVVGARRRRRALRGQGLRRAGVGGESPAALASIS